MGNDLGSDFEIRGTYTLTPNLTLDFGWDHLWSGAFRKKFRTVLANIDADDSNYL